MIEQIAITSLITALILLSQHYYPWRLLIKQDLPRPAAYVLGVLAIIVPLSGLYGWWAFHPVELAVAHLLALWAVVASGGLTVIGAYGLDWVIGRVRLAGELVELTKLHEERTYGEGEAGREPGGGKG